METEFKEPQKVNTALQNEISGLDSTEAQTLAKVPNTEKSDNQFETIGTQISQFLSDIPQELNKLYTAYKTPLIGLAVLSASLITFKIVLAILAAVDSIPLMSPFFELIGIGFTGWFVFRYLIKASTRKELSVEFESFKKQFGTQNTTESLN